MKNWQKRLLAWVVPMALVAAGWLWYTRPLTLEELSPDLDWDCIESVAGFENYDFDIDFIQTDYVPATEADVQALIQSLRTATARRSLSKTLLERLPFLSGGRVRYGAEGKPFEVNLFLRDQAGYVKLSLIGTDLEISRVIWMEGHSSILVCTFSQGDIFWEQGAAFVEAHK